MKVLIGGSNGLLGSALSSVLEEEDHDVVPLVRSEPEGNEISWEQVTAEDGHRLLEPFDAVVHLGGVNIGEKRWNSERKQALYDSRIHTTGALSNVIAKMTRHPEVFIVASAVGFYGNTGDGVVNESSPQGKGFLADLVHDWEAACEPARQAGVRVVNLRNGIILSKHGGLLERLTPVFMAGMGGRLGNGEQWMSWIALRDAVNAISFALHNTSVHGPINVCSPNPVRNNEFTKALGKAVKRPTPVPVFPWMLNVAYGKEMTDEMLLVSQRAVPSALTKAGFRCQYPHIREALDSIFAD